MHTWCFNSNQLFPGKVDKDRYKKGIKRVFLFKGVLSREVPYEKEKEKKTDNVNSKKSWEREK
jgi:hypothetical protein